MGSTPRIIDPIGKSAACAAALGADVVIDGGVHIVKSHRIAIAILDTAGLRAFLGLSQVSDQMLWIGILLEIGVIAPSIARDGCLIVQQVQGVRIQRGIGQRVQDCRPPEVDAGIGPLSSPIQ